METSTITWKVKDERLNKSETLTFNHSKHSYQRAKARNITPKEIVVVIEYGKAYFKQGMIFYVLGERQLPNDVSQDISPNLIVVVSGNSNTIITCYRSNNPFKHIKKKQKRLADLFYNAA